TEIQGGAVFQKGSNALTITVDQKAFIVIKLTPEESAQFEKELEIELKKTLGPTPPDTPTPVTGTHSGGSGPMIWWILLALVIAIAMGAAGAGGYWYYFRRYLPRKELEPYWNAVRAIRARNYEAALPALTSIESKLPSDLRYNARFFSALCHVHLDEE